MMAILWHYGPRSVVGICTQNSFLGNFCILLHVNIPSGLEDAGHAHQKMAAMHACTL